MRLGNPGFRFGSWIAVRTRRSMPVIGSPRPLISSCTVNWLANGFGAPGANVGPAGSGGTVIRPRAARTAAMLIEPKLWMVPDASPWAAVTHDPDVGAKPGAHISLQWKRPPVAN